jgi:hypothetical protein
MTLPNWLWRRVIADNPHATISELRAEYARRLDGVRRAA